MERVWVVVLCQMLNQSILDLFHFQTFYDVMIHFLFCICYLIFFLIIGSQQFHYKMPRCGFLGIYPIWLGFLGDVFQQFWQILVYYLFKYSFQLDFSLLSFCNSNYSYITLFAVVSQILDALFYFFPSLFQFGLFLLEVSSSSLILSIL